MREVRPDESAFVDAASLAQYLRRVIAYLFVLAVAPEFQAPTPNAPADAAAAVAWLDDASAERRERGERWLARELAPEHGALLRPVLESGSWESALRVRSVLATAPRGLDLAVRFGQDGDGRVRTLARAAIEERVARWTPGWERPLDARGMVIGALVGKGAELVALRTRARDGDVDRAVAALVRGARGMPNCVVLPGARPSANGEEKQLVAGFDVVLGQLARAHDLVIAGLGFSDDLDGRAARCVVLRGSDEVEGSGLELVASWCLLAASEEPEPTRRSATRALGRCGWPDAVAWMEERWLAEREPAWLDGLLAAADRGALAPSFRTRAERDWITRYLDEPGHGPALELRAERVAGLARALALAGPRDESGGDARAWIALDPASGGGLARWARLVVLEGLGIADQSELARLDAHIRTWSSDDAPESPALLERALRVRGARPADLALTVGAIELERPEALFELASRTSGLGALPAVLVAARAEPPTRWDDPTALPKAWSAALRRAACQWMLSSRRPAASSSTHVAALLAASRSDDRQAACGLLLSATRHVGPERMRSAVGDSLLRVALDLASDDERATAARAVLRDEHDLVPALALGGLAARGDTRARDELQRALQLEPLVPLVVQALDWAVTHQRARQEEAGERALVALVREWTRAAPSAARAQLRPDAWPKPTTPDPVDLDSLYPEPPQSVR